MTIIEATLWSIILVSAWVITIVLTVVFLQWVDTIVTRIRDTRREYKEKKRLWEEAEEDRKAYERLRNNATQ